MYMSGTDCFVEEVSVLKMPFDEASEAVGSIDVVEKIAAGGLCFEETESVVKCGPKKIVAGVYLILHLGLSITSAVLERMAIDACISKELEINPDYASSFQIRTRLADVGIEVYRINKFLDLMNTNNTNNMFNRGLQIWEGSFWVLTFAVIPLQVWLLVCGLLGLRYCPCKFNPFCFCFKKEDSQSSKYKKCMEVNLLLFLMFDDLVHIAISIGRMNYRSASPASYYAFKQAFSVNVAMYIETAADSFNLLYRWASIHWFYMCREKTAGRRRERERGRGRRIIMAIFRFLQFLVSATTLYFAVVLITGLSSWPGMAIFGLYIGWLIGIFISSVFLTGIVIWIHACCCG